VDEQNEQAGPAEIEKKVIPTQEKPNQEKRKSENNVLRPGIDNNKG